MATYRYIIIYWHNVSVARRMRMRLISWNVMGGYGGHMSAQAEALGER
jgi:hypothetical protein